MACTCSVCRRTLEITADFSSWPQVLEKEGRDLPDHTERKPRRRSARIHLFILPEVGGENADLHQEHHVGC